LIQWIAHDNLFVAADLSEVDEQDAWEAHEHNCVRQEDDRYRVPLLLEDLPSLAIVRNDIRDRRMHS
jgi:hypothetical protein